MTNDFPRFQMYSENTIRLMGNYMAIHHRLGEIQAQLNWVKCGDPDGLSRRSGELSWAMARSEKECKQLELILCDVLSEHDMKLLVDTCVEERDLRMEKQECLIVGEYKPLHATFNVGAVKVMTDKNIPADILFGLSLGWKFLFPYTTSSENIHSVLAQVEDCIEQTIPEAYLRRTYKKVSEIIKNRSLIQYNDEVQWLRFVSLRSNRFFKENIDVFATKSDKGGHTVIIENNRYEIEIKKMLNNNVYEKIDDSPLKQLIESEKKLIKFLSSNEKTKSWDDAKRFWKWFQPNLLQLARFYGLPKVHKQEFCLRPIMSLIGAPSFATGKVFDMMLKTIFPRSFYHIRDSVEFKEFLDGVSLKENEILVSFDVISMFTSIPRELVKQIVLEKSNDFLIRFGMGRKILERFLDFLLHDSTVFTAADCIYRQKDGLPMGSCISPTLARITMDKVVSHLLKRVPEINFIRIFVDDTITALHKNSVEKALQALNDFNVNIKFTCEVEKENQSIDFLNMTLFRSGSSVITNWYRKRFASGRLLNFMSSHKRTTIVETAINFIIMVHKLSSGDFFQSNRQKVVDTLRENSFPETVIISLMNEYYTLMRTRKEPNEKAKKYAVYPHAICESKRIKKTLHKYKDDKTAYSDSTRNSKVNYVKTKKTFISKRLRGNMIVHSTCTCKKKHKIEATDFNQNAEMLIKTMKTTFVKCTRSLHAFRKFRVSKGLAYGSQTKTLAKYFQWQYRGSFVNTRTGRPEFYLARLLKDIKPRR